MNLLLDLRLATFFWVTTVANFDWVSFLIAFDFDFLGLQRDRRILVLLQLDVLNDYPRLGVCLGLTQQAV